MGVRWFTVYLNLVQKSIRLENTFARFNVTSSINHSYFWPSIRIQRQIILLVEKIQIQIQIMMSVYVSNFKPSIYCVVDFLRSILIALPCLGTELKNT